MMTPDELRRVKRALEIALEALEEDIQQEGGCCLVCNNEKLFVQEALDLVNRELNKE